MKVVIIGTGNTATVLGRCMLSVGHDIVQVVGRNAKAANELAVILQSETCTDPSSISKGADIYVVAISDRALPDLHEWLQLGRHLVVHTSASVSKNVLEKVSRNFGVLYPLQSLRKEQLHIPEIPFLVDGNTADDIALIQDFALSMSGQVQIMDDAQRLRLHVAAVLSSNFTNHLYRLASDYCRKEKIDFSLLLPLIKETAGRLETLSPEQSQTGPAVRNDLPTIERHLEVLKEMPEIRRVYEILTESIRGIKS